MYYYSKYAKSLNHGEDIEPCKVYYPANTKFDQTGFPSNSGAYYDLNGRIILPGLEGADLDITSYENWDVFGHEYGHHVGRSLGFCFGPGESHSAYIDNVYSGYNIIKYSDHISERSLSLAWLESWPTYFAEIAQASFPKEIKSSYCHGYVSDKKYESNNFRKERYFSIDHGENLTDILCHQLIYIADFR